MNESGARALATIDLLNITFSDEERTSMLAGLLLDKYEGDERKITLFIHLYRELFDTDKGNAE